MIEEVAKELLFMPRNDLIKIVINIQKKNKDLQQRIDKAINYIYKNYGLLDKYQIEILEDILRNE